MNRGTSVEVSEIIKRFGDVAAVAGVSLEAKAGDFVALLGPSGSGKTTTLRIIAGFESPDSGKVLLGGRDVTHLPVHQRNIGFVFQGFSLFPHLSVLENVMYPLRLRRVPEAKRHAQAREVLKLVRLSDLEDRRPHQLSGGQQQRVTLARALVYEPEVVLLDEPFASLDRRLREQMRKEVRLIQERVGTTFILVTHDQEEALELADTIYVLHDGNIAQSGPPEEIYRNPQSRFVADFLGEMNLLKVLITSTNDGRYLARFGALDLQLARVVGTHGPALLAIRPESIRFTNDATNCVPARILTRTYRGPMTRYTIALDDDAELIVTCGSVEAQFVPGDETVVGWEPDDALVLEYSNLDASWRHGPDAAGFL